MTEQVNSLNKTNMQIAVLWCGSLKWVEEKTGMTRDEPQKHNYVFFVFALSGKIGDQTPKPADISTEIRLDCFDKKHSLCLKLPFNWLLRDKDWNAS